MLFGICRRSGMRQRSWIGVGALALIVAGSAVPLVGQNGAATAKPPSAKSYKAPRTRVGSSRPAGHLEQRHHHAARAAEGSRGPRVPERPGVGGACEGRGDPRGKAPGRSARRRRTRLQQRVVGPRRSAQAHLAHHRPAEREAAAAHRRGAESASPRGRRLAARHGPADS